MNVPPLDYSLIPTFGHTSRVRIDSGAHGVATTRARLAARGRSDSASARTTVSRLPTENLHTEVGSG